MKRYIYLGLALFVLIFGIVFAVLNADSVQLHYYLGSPVELPLSLILVLAMIFGAILGILASLNIIIRTRRTFSRLKRSAEVAEKEVVNLRNIPIKDDH